jgi:hypothetical protein
MLIANILNQTLYTFFNILYKTAPFWGPLLVGLIAWRAWVHYIRRLYIFNMKWSLLQVTIPREVSKSPQAMELFINSLYQTAGTATFYHKYWLGNVRNWFSLELVSIEGKIYFFIRTPKFFKNLIESQVYAQYPQAEIFEADDYTDALADEMKKTEWTMWGCEFILTKPDPYPIKTYVDYGLDRSVGLEEEQKIDPITPVLEYMGAIGPGEQIWLQVLVRATLDEKKWMTEAKDEIQKVIKDALFKPEEGTPSSIHLSPGQQEIVKSLERSISKLGFDVGVRGIYLSKKEIFNPANIAGLTGTFRQYNSLNLNGFRPYNVTGFDYPWQDPTGKRANALKQELFDAYRERSLFYMPHKYKFVAMKRLERKHFVLNSEELATIYHFPGRVAETPTFKRIEAKKSEPPVNLPV